MQELLKNGERRLGVYRINVKKGLFLGEKVLYGKIFDSRISINMMKTSVSCSVLAHKLFDKECNTAHILKVAYKPLAWKDSHGF